MSGIVDKNGWQTGKELPNTLNTDQTVAEWMNDRRWEQGFFDVEEQGGGNFASGQYSSTLDQGIETGSQAQGGDGTDPDADLKKYYDSIKTTGEDTNNMKWILYAAIAIGIISIIKK